VLLSCNICRAETLEWTERRANQSYMIPPHTTDIMRPSAYTRLFNSQENLTETLSLSIARIFGGFPESFYKTYHEYRPKTEPADQYNLRMDLYELFHYLNHMLIFGVSGILSNSQPSDAK
jgi:hypothetical protein